jgi:hypothetical protein
LSATLGGIAMLVTGVEDILEFLIAGLLKCRRILEVGLFKLGSACSASGRCGGRRFNCPWRFYDFFLYEY